MCESVCVCVCVCDSTAMTSSLVCQSTWPQSELTHWPAAVIRHSDSNCHEVCVCVCVVVTNICPHSHLMGTKSKSSIHKSLHFKTCYRCGLD